ncbi:hypothetical protein [Syntrophaceticus schinkii]|uniref:Uncharacterized protein n=1 Tax=Syntrophaceticus schinkii TaxID=499207 RepID=A0A0B7ML32_9FIRM|nr:hypothetical protein [Syntrophaceticus schinkii]CEO88908.1 hypothetical protein SSCH_30012 [Syntrophaceticus schinkii]
MTKEQSFFKILECFFVGTQVKGQSGYIKLMQIRSHYYKKHIIPSLKNEINQLVHFPEYREEIFEKLYTFSATTSARPVLFAFVIHPKTMVSMIRLITEETIFFLTGQPICSTM